jgi:hypothetical protein
VLLLAAAAPHPPAAWRQSAAQATPCSSSSVDGSAFCVHAFELKTLSNTGQHYRAQPAAYNNPNTQHHNCLWSDLFLD